MRTARNQLHLFLLVEDEFHMDMGAPPCSSSSRQRGSKGSSSPRASAPRNYRDFDWLGADLSEQPARKRKYVTKKSLEHNDAAAVLSLAPLIQVIGNSLDLEQEGEGEPADAIDGGTTCSSDDVEREWG